MCSTRRPSWFNRLLMCMWLSSGIGGGGEDVAKVTAATRYKHLMGRPWVHFPTSCRRRSLDNLTCNLEIYYLTIWLMEVHTHTKHLAILMWDIHIYLWDVVWWHLLWISSGSKSVVMIWTSELWGSPLHVLGVWGSLVYMVATTWPSTQDYSRPGWAWDITKVYRYRE